MTSTAPAVESPPAASRAAGPAVWGRLWRTHPSAAKDDALIARERRSPRWTLIVDRLDAAFGAVDGLRTIELGSGRGDLSALLAERGAEVTLLDASRAALDQARHRFDRLGLTARCAQGDLRSSCDTLSERFDVVLSSGLIEHFQGADRTRIVGVHHTVLRPGGMAIISVPHAWCVPYRVWKFYLELRGWWPYGVEIPYTRRELVARVRSAGFLETEIRCVGFRQSIADYWINPLWGRKPDWVERTGCLDGCLGATLLMFARRGAARGSR